MYEVVETGIFTKDKAKEFKRWFEKEIGTEIEENEHDINEISFTIFEVSNSEFKKIQKKAKELGEKW